MVAGRPLAVMSEMKVSQEDVAARVQPWRGVGAGTASRFMANTALSRGARTNGAVCAAPGGSRHHLYHRRQYSVIDWPRTLSERLRCSRSRSRSPRPRQLPARLPRDLYSRVSMPLRDVQSARSTK